MQDLTTKLTAMKAFFDSGATKSYDFRRQQLQKLRQALQKAEGSLHEALHADLRKNVEEAFITETGFVMAELKNAIANLKTWMRADSTWTNLLNMPGSSRIEKEPMGVVLLIGPWNYPLQLLFTPLVGAIAAGNCVVLKSSEFAPATGAIMRQIINDCFEEQYVLLVEGDGATVVPAMMKHFTFDQVFYTGSTAVGKLIYQMAAERLVPVVLELGGKSPCVVEADANIAVAARRIVVTKFSNCGQMCVAPDYLLVHNSVKEPLIAALKKCIQDFYGADASESYSYGKIINERQWNRLVGYLHNGKILQGGSHDKEKLFIEPTLMVDCSLESPIMQEEIFGPLLPIIGFDSLTDAKAIIQRHPNPLAFYVFTSSRAKEQQWIEAIPFGGGCVNNASYHLTNHHLPFGGRGFSGTGAYHGKFSFDTFSHRKAIMKTPTWFDPWLKYPSFKGRLGFFRKMM
jgi:aldehyde dehydrogenase (NAD+)